MGALCTPKLIADIEGSLGVKMEPADIEKLEAKLERAAQEWFAPLPNSVFRVVQRQVTSHEHAVDDLPPIVDRMSTRQADGEWTDSLLSFEDAVFYMVHETFHRNQTNTPKVAAGWMIEESTDGGINWHPLTEAGVRRRLMCMWAAHGLKRPR